MKNYYEILEVNKKASKEIIERAYKVLVKKYHPDLYMEEPRKKCEKKIREINEAYDVLSNEILRDRYDRELEEAEYEKFLKRREMYNQDIYIEENNERTSPKKTRKQVNNNYNKVKEEKKYEVGTLGSMFSILKHSVVVLNEQRINNKKQGKSAIEPNAVMAVIATILILIVLGIIMWFIPFTNGFIRTLTVDNPLINWMF